MSKPKTIELGGSEYVILPKTEFLRLVSGAANAKVPRGSVDAVAYARSSIGAELRLAREQAGLTQAELAKRLKKSQALVALPDAIARKYPNANREFGWQ